jgi:hypothetical protein
LDWIGYSRRLTAQTPDFSHHGLLDTVSPWFRHDPSATWPHLDKEARHRGHLQIGYRRGAAQTPLLEGWDLMDF